MLLMILIAWVWALSLEYPLLLPGYTRMVCPGKDSAVMSRGALSIAQMGALWRWARQGPMRLGWS